MTKEERWTMFLCCGNPIINATWLLGANDESAVLDLTDLHCATCGTPYRFESPDGQNPLSNVTADHRRASIYVAKGRLQ